MTREDIKKLKEKLDKINCMEAIVEYAKNYNKVNKDRFWKK